MSSNDQQKMVLTPTLQPKSLLYKSPFPNQPKYWLTLVHMCHDSAWPAGMAVQHSIYCVIVVVIVEFA